MGTPQAAKMYSFTQSCALQLLPALRVTTGITHLRLCSLSGYGGEVEAYKLGEALASLPLLGDLEVLIGMFNDLCHI